MSGEPGLWRPLTAQERADYHRLLRARLLPPPAPSAPPSPLRTLLPAGLVLVVIIIAAAAVLS